jgi:glucan 1,3-beta-glucosidase
VSAAGAYSAWQTGGAGAGTIAAAETRSYPWPPAALSGLGGAAYNLVPTYTPTATISTLPPAQLTPSAPQGNGWYDAQDTASAMVTVSGCSYPNAWDSAGAVAPTALCPAGASPQVTAAPAATATSAAAATAATATSAAAATAAAAAATTSVAAATSAADTASTAAA